MNAKYKVTFIEHERGWGSRFDSEEFFDSYEEALDRVEKFNAKNNEKHIPDWYMTTSMPVLVDLDRK